MKKLILTLTLILSGYAVSQASILTKQPVELEVGSNPVSILENPSDGIVHIFCAGIDANENNTFDEGEDEKPTWWTYNPAGGSVEPTMVKEFDNYFVSPFKPSIGTGLINITFKSDVMNNEFVGATKFEVYSIANFSLLYGDVVSQSEVLTTNYYSEYAITLTRLNGSDLLSDTDLITDETSSITLSGNIIDFTFVDLDDDGKDEIAILIDNQKLAFYKFGETIQLITEMDLTLLDDYTGKFGHLYAEGNSIYTTFANKGTLLKIITDSEGSTETEVITYSELGELSNPTSFFPIDNNTSVITNLDNNLIVKDDNAIEEMHRTTTLTDFVYANETAVYITGEKKVFIYDIESELNIDPSYNSHGFFGYQPLDIFKSNDNFYVLNLGIDFNFDGNLDGMVGDQKPSINQFDLKDPDYLFANNENRINFDFSINFPLNTNISSDGDIALPSGNSVQFYNVIGNEVNESFDAGMYVSTAFRVLDYLVLGQRDYAENKSYIRIIKGDFIDVKTEVGANVIDCIVYQNASGFGVVSVSEGNFGEPDAKINIIKLSTLGIGENTAIDAGTGGNSIVANADQTKAAIVMNGSHEVHILNLLTGEIDLTFSTGTTGFGGPRDAKFSGDRLYVTTYSNQIIMFDANTGDKLSSIMIDGNTEGLAISDNFLLVTNNQYSNYQPSNRIFAYDIDKISNVEEAIPSEQTIRVYPHPVSNDFHLVSDDLAGTNDIAIINSQGKIVATHSGSSNGAIALNVDALGLVAGNYTAVINGTRAVRFVVIK